jgi:hypothetical protein
MKVFLFYFLFVFVASNVVASFEKSSKMSFLQDFIDDEESSAKNSDSSDNYRKPQKKLKNKKSVGAKHKKINKKMIVNFFSGMVRHFGGYLIWKLILPKKYHWKMLNGLSNFTFFIAASLGVIYYKYGSFACFGMWVNSLRAINFRGFLSYGKLTSSQDLQDSQDNIENKNNTNKDNDNVYGSQNPKPGSVFQSKSNFSPDDILRLAGKDS